MKIILFTFIIFFMLINIIITVVIFIIINITIVNHCIKNLLHAYKIIIKNKAKKQTTSIKKSFKIE